MEVIESTVDGPRFHDADSWLLDACPAEMFPLFAPLALLRFAALERVLINLLGRRDHSIQRKLFTNHAPSVSRQTLTLCRIIQLADRFCQGFRVSNRHQQAG